MARQTQGIQQLLAAEKRAAEKVAEAKKRNYLFILYVSNIFFFIFHCFSFILLTITVLLLFYQNDYNFILLFCEIYSILKVGVAYLICYVKHI